MRRFRELQNDRRHGLRPFPPLRADCVPALKVPGLDGTRASLAFAWTYTRVAGTLIGELDNSGFEARNCHYRYFFESVKGCFAEKCNFSQFTTTFSFLRVEGALR